MAEFKYWAFLSYSHRDRKWGDWLHKALETYRVPHRLVGKDSSDGKIPKRLFPIFRDREELRVSADLGTNINDALSQSRYLIVICSPHAAQSRWVGQEIIEFKKLEREDRILALIVAGEPNASEGKSGFAPEDECFPKPMRYQLAANGDLSSQPAEPLAADAREDKDGKRNAKLKLLAGLLGITYDDLRRRDHERRLRRARAVGAVALILVLIFAGLAVALFYKAREANIQKQEAIQQEAKAKNTSVQADFDFAVMSRQNTDAVDPRALAHLARALRTSGNARLPRQYLVSLLRDAHWHLPETEPMRHESFVMAASFSPDGRRIVTASWDKTARVWDAQTGKPVGEPMHHNEWVKVANFSPDGRWILTGFGGLWVWDAETHKPVGEVPCTVDLSASFSADGRRIVAAGMDSATVWDAAAVWDATYWHDVGKMPHEGYVRTASFSADGRWIVTACADKTARVWDAETYEQVGKPMHHEAPVMAANFSPDGRRIATASNDKIARVWDAETYEQVGKPMHHEAPVMAVNFSPDGRRIATASLDGTARIWDAETYEQVGEPMRHEGFVMAASFSPDGRRIATASWDNTARIWDAETHEPVGEPRPDYWVVAPMRDEDYWVVARDFSPDGRRSVTSERNVEGLGFIAKVWEVDSGERVGKPMRHAATINTTSFSVDGRRIVTASSDKTAQVWEVDSGKPVGEPMRHGDSVVAASFSADGRRIVTASNDKTARVWDADSGKPLGEPIRHKNPVIAASFSVDGRRIFTRSEDGTARVWDIAVDLDLPLPSWVPELAEALGGRKLNEEGMLVPPNRSIVEVRKELLALKGDDFWSRFGRWFFMRGPERTISADSNMTVGEFYWTRFCESLFNEAEESFQSPLDPEANKPK